jgi:hypothetical protein
MAHSREVRLPFCDHRVAEFAFGLPPDLLVGDGQVKRVLRFAIDGLVPDPIVTRPKQGFIPPQEGWLVGPLREWILDLTHEPGPIGDLLGPDMRSLAGADEAVRAREVPWLWELANLLAWSRYSARMRGSPPSRVLQRNQRPIATFPERRAFARGSSLSHVLIITFGYEPLAHVSATRPAWMGRELTKLGWDVSVLTVDWSHPLPAAVASPEESVSRALTKISPRRIAIDGRLSDPAFDPLAIPRTTEPPVRHAWLRRLRTARNAVGWGPYSGWARNGFRAARLLHQRAPVDGPPRSAPGGVPGSPTKDPWGLFYSRSLRVVRWATAPPRSPPQSLRPAPRGHADEQEFGSPIVV